MYTPLVLLPLLTLGAIAQTTVEQVFFPEPYDDNVYDGSVVAVADGLTTYAIACESGTMYCSTGQTYTVTAGPSTIAAQTTTDVSGIPGNVTETCVIDAATSATCVYSVNINVQGIDSTIILITTLGADEFHYHSVTLTAGVGKLAAAPTAAATSGSSGSAATAAATGGSGSSSNAATATSASSSASSSSSSKGAAGAAAPMITGMGVAGVAGAAVLGLAALL